MIAIHEEIFKKIFDNIIYETFSVSIFLMTFYEILQNRDCSHNLGLHLVKILPTFDKNLESFL